MWTTKITNIVKNIATVNVSVEFLKDGELYRTFTFDNVSNLQSLKTLIFNQLRQFKKIDELDETTLLGEVDLSEFTPIVADPPALTLEEAQDADFVSKVASLRQAETAISLGLLSDTNPIYVNLRANLKTIFKPRMLKYL